MPLTTQQKKKRLRNKADKIYQQIGRMLYEDAGCIFIGCKEPYSCLHHYHPKSTASSLRYNIKNGINICAKHHCSIHMSDSPTLNNQIVEIKGLEWVEELEVIKRNTLVKNSLEYYNLIIKNLSTIYGINN